MLPTLCKKPVPIGCPVQPCSMLVLRHHLYVRHNVDVIPSHEMARNAVEGRYVGEEVTRG
jgi:hypothetical protein